MKKFVREIGATALTLLAVLAFRTCIYEPYVVPSESMLPTTIVGDRVLVQKFAYGISRYSFPFSPNLFKGRLLAFGTPARGDVAVFETDQVYIKRVVGLPGDTVQMMSGRLFINNAPVELSDSGIWNGQYTIQTEALPGGRTHAVLNAQERSGLDDTTQVTVPPEHYFMMGDNRDNSNDSRADLGFVHIDNFLGRVERVLFSSPEVRWYNPAFLLQIKPDRFFMKVQ